MRLHQLFLVRTAVLAATPPPAGWHATGLPGDVWSFVQIDEWDDLTQRDVWEDLPGVIEITFGMLDNVIPANAAALLTDWGVLSTDTVRAALKKVRAHWPMARH